MRWRYLPFYLSLIFSLFLFLWRLFSLTIVQGSYYRNLSESNRVSEINIRSPRGLIYDRHGQVLARNKPVYRYQVESSKYKVVSNEQALEIQAKGGSEAAKLQLDLGREYPAASIAGHSVGYMGEVGEDEIRNSLFGKKLAQSKQLEARSYSAGEAFAYKLGDFIGRTGIEEQYENLLRGTDGKELIETDALGKKIKSLGRIEPIPGQNLTLSMDLDLQKVAAKEMAGKIGAVVVSDPKTGEILALYSAPSFDPGNLSDLNNLGNLGDRPFFDRVISGLYPPGSTFKIITASAGLESGKITAQTQIEDTGVISVGPFQFPNWYWLQYGQKEGLVDIVKALKRSNDTFFYKVGEMVGIEGLEAWAKKFGLSKPLGIDLPGEAAGRIRLLRDWYLGDTYHTAIGQGDLEVTPLQINFWTNVIANGGKLCRPRMIKINTTNTTNNQILPIVQCKDIGLKKETIDLIKEGMKEACSPGGTGWPLFDFKVKSRVIPSEVEGSLANASNLIPVACKTGTAEYGDPKNNTHAWFTIFAPVNDPELTVTVLVEGGGEGSNVAAPIAKKILEEWFGR